MSARGIPFHCPYCGDEDLRPSEEGHGAWECHSCLRAFSLKMLGMVARPTLTPSPGSGTSAAGSATSAAGSGATSGSEASA